MTDAFREHVYLKFQAYSSLLLTLPFGDTRQTGILVPLLGLNAAEDLEKGQSPTRIVEDFLKENLPGASTEQTIDQLFAIIKYVERQVVLFDAVEDAAYDRVHDIKGPGTVSDEMNRVFFKEKMSEMIAKIDDFSLRIVLTAHPTQFYPGRILSIISDLDKVLVENDISGINELLAQLGKTPMVQKVKPTPYTEAVRIIWYLENVFYKAISGILADLSTGIGRNIHDMPLENLIRLGFWPGGDRDGNPFVRAETTMSVAQELRRTIMICYYRDLRKLKRKLTYKDVYWRMNEVSAKLSAAIADRSKGYQTVEEMLSDLSAVRERLEEQQVKIAIEYLDAFTARIRTFRFHFATIDIRQDSSVHDALLELIIDSVGLRYKWEESDEDGRLNILKELNFNTEEFETEDDVLRDVFESMAVMNDIVAMNGQRACERYIISNSQSRLHIMQVFHLLRWVHGSVEYDVVPLFETVSDLANAPAIMDALYKDDVYGPHVRKRGSRQTVMVGFSDGTKDGGYMQANWSIFRAKEEITRVSRNNGVEVVFFDGRGGPPARGGGKANKFYSSLGPTIEDKEVQLTIQGQTISSNFGTVVSARFNLEQLLTAGFENTLFKNTSASLDPEAREVLEEIARIGYEYYSEFKNDPDFLPYLEQMGTLPYYAMTNIGSRPVKRKGDGRPAFKSLRAIPFVGSWNQMKQNVPGFFGLGKALQVFKERGELDKVQLLFERSLFFRTLIENSMMSLLKSYFALTRYLEDHDRFGRIWNLIHDEYQLTRDILLEISGQSQLLETSPNVGESIKLREELVLPVLVIQQYALDTIRRLEEAGKEEEAQVYHTMVMRTMFAIINAGRNSA